jgi:hypothetical protein
MSRRRRDLPCNGCGGPGPFARDRVHHGVQYYHSKCVHCRTHLERAWRHRHARQCRARARVAYHRRTLRAMQARRATEGPTRLVVNYFGRLAAQAQGLRWCAWGQHACDPGEFGAKTSPCRECHAMQYRLREWQQSKQHR